VKKITNIDYQFIFLKMVNIERIESMNKFLKHGYQRIYFVYVENTYGQTLHVSEPFICPKEAVNWSIQYALKNSFPHCMTNYIIRYSDRIRDCNFSTKHFGMFVNVLETEIT
jgi:cystathionine beta-lyase family protein involved in aluminum resistance